MRARDRNSLAEQLAAARQRIAELEGRLSQLEHRDPLTGSLLSLRSFRTQLELDVARAERYGRPLSVALLDVDRFRSLNLEHGYATGDAVLASLGHLIADQTRMNDLACRMGSDEFAILFGETEAVEALTAIERILIELEDIEVGAIRGIAVSVGVAGLQPGQRPEAFLAAAGAALEQARAASGSQVILHAGDQSEKLLELGQGNVIAALASALEERDRYNRKAMPHADAMAELTANAGTQFDPDIVQALVGYLFGRRQAGLAAV